MIARELRKAFTSLLRKVVSDEQGQVLVLFLVMMLVLLGLAAMALDVGLIMWSRGTQQNAADAAALAGVRLLPGDASAEATAVAVARDYAALNGFDSSDPGVEVTPVVTAVSITSPSGSTVQLPALEVTISRTLPPGLRAAVGAGDIVVPARAVAVVTEVINKCNVLPMAIENRVQRYDQDGNPIGSPVPYDQTYGYMVRLRMSPGNAYESGNFGSLALSGGHGASAYRDYIANGGGCVESDILPTETGAMDGPTEQGFAALIEKAIGPSASWPACGSPHPDNPAIPVECTLGIPDNVHWEGDKPYGLGSPNPAVESGCSGPPTPDNPYPEVEVGVCPRVLTVPVVEAGAWPSGSGTVHVSEWAAFYVIGTVGHGSNRLVVGSFLKHAVPPIGDPTWEDPVDASQVGFYLWQ